MLVGGEFLEEKLLRLQGVLEDHIYAMEIQMDILLPDGVISAIRGWMKRYTTPVCPKAVEVLQNAVGMSLREEGWVSRVNREIGRKGCSISPRFSSNAAGAWTRPGWLMTWPRALKSRHQPYPTRSPGHGLKTIPKFRVLAWPVRRERWAMRIDLHIHTRPRSPCSAIDPQELIEAARRAGLDGICLTEHQNRWDPGEIEELGRSGGIRIFQGNEVTTNQGDILVWGYDEDPKGVAAIQDLRREVEAFGGLMVAAHPFRGFLLFGITQLQLSVEQAVKRTVFQHVDGLEIYNCKVTDPENEMARQVAERLGLLGVAGSDAHRLDEVGRCVTIFPREIRTERELMEELRARRFTIEYREQANG